MTILRQLADASVKINVGPGSDSVNNLPTGKASDVLAGGLNIFYIAIGVVAVIVIIIAGYMFVSSHGDASSVSKAKSTILYAVVGLIVVMLAFVVTNFVIGL
jgi:hypothetical protein